jgi:hypothetical protein
LNPDYHKRSKHIEVKYHWIREHVDPDGLGTARLRYVQTDNQTADIFTKAVSGDKFTKHVATVIGKKKSVSREVEVENPIRRKVQRRY